MKYISKYLGTILLSSLVGVAATAQDRVVSVQSLLEEMIDCEAVARWPQPEYVGHQESSYDRRSKKPSDPNGWFANHDNMDQPINAWKVEKRENRYEWVLMDVAGPGCVVRFWTGGSPPIGTVRFYLDGAEQPAIAQRLGDLLGGKSFVPRPLGIENAGRATNLYLPIPYAQHCKITYEQGANNPQARPPGRWYNIEYRTYPADTKVQTFTMAQFTAIAPTVSNIAKTLLDPPPAQGSASSMDQAIEPGKEMTLDLPQGPAAVRLCEIRLDGLKPNQDQQALRSTVLRMTCDGEETIWSPLSEFCGSGVGVNELKSWYRSVAKDGTMTCRWVMPYQKSARMAVLNLGKEKVSVKLKTLTSAWKWDDRSMYFHSQWRYRYPLHTRPMTDWNYITITGKGVYLGDTLAVMNPTKAWWGEGDEKIWVDGENFPSYFGTGSEDYYGYAWGAANVFQGPFCNQPRVGPRNQGHTTNTRTRGLDAIPFAKSLKFDMEIWHWAECDMAYSVATYWYGLPGAKSNLSPAPADATAPISPPPPAARKAGR